MRLTARRLKSRAAAGPRKPGVPRGLIASRMLSSAGKGAYQLFARPPLARKVYGRVGNLEVRLARTRSELRQAQRLRYEVFYEEMSATPSLAAQMRRRDSDPYDALCDHLLVVDLATTELGWTNRRRHKVVGTYRILRQEATRNGRGFYTQGEYDIADLIRRQPAGFKFMEVGRSCVLKPYRTKRTVELLWHGLWAYVRDHKVDVMVGCASFLGTDPREHAMALSFLHHYAQPPPEWRCRAHPRLFQSMNLLPKEAIDTKAALKAMPPLIKGYLRLGCYIGDGAVIDRQFGTTDVMIILPVAKIDPRYFEHFGARDETRSRIAIDA